MLGTRRTARRAQGVATGLRGVRRHSPASRLNLIQKWLGRGRLNTRAIYANAVGAEENDITSKMSG
jgi:integrase/recombinase XerD